ncbi:macrolide family glycosyltransferase [Amycolatopsis sp. NPDC059021]|uniref:macrolide family glycosyltransferase n=1 Tax=Amycolatopsis sp. NPDC059021 TaxID=3346704 RepID=UPI003672E6E8
MSRVVMAGMPAWGHVNPSLPIMRELTRRGVEVTYYTGEEFRAPVERAGCEFRAYPPGTISVAGIAEATQSGSTLRVVTRVLRATESLLPFLRDELAGDPPAAIAFDSNAIWGRMAAASLGVPMISLMTTFLVGGKDLSCLTAREWACFLGPTIRDLPRTVAAKQRVVRRFGKRIYPPSPTLPMRGDVTIFPIPRWLQGDDPRIDASCHYVGPTFPEGGDSAPDAELAAFLDEPGPLVLVSLGTLHAGSGAFFHACFEALGDLPARVLIATGGVDPAGLGRPPAGTLVRASVPQREVLRHASAFVTHGGMNSALEGLARGVPLVVVPQQAEQLIIGRKVAGRGAGTVLRHAMSRRPVPAGELRTAVERALTDPSLRVAAKEAGASLGEGGGAVAAAEAIQNRLGA